MGDGPYCIHMHVWYLNVVSPHIGIMSVRQTVEISLFTLYCCRPLLLHCAQILTSCGAGHNKPPTPSECNWLWAMAGDNKLTSDQFTRIDPKFNQVVPWSLHTFLKISCNSVQPFSRNVADKETKKSSENNTPSPYQGRDNNNKCSSM